MKKPSWPATDAAYKQNAKARADKMSARNQAKKAPAEKPPRRYGGPRPNAGAKKIDPAMKKHSGSIALTKDQWASLDEKRGDISRGDYIAKKLKLGGEA